jgi:transposase
MIIQIVLGLRIECHFTKTKACEFVARRTTRRLQSVFDVVNAWVENGVIMCYKGEARGRAAENYPVPTNLSKEQRTVVLTEVARLNSEGQPATARVLQSFIKLQFGLLIPAKRLCQQFRAWGGKYKKMKELTPIDRDFQERRVAQFIVRYAKALKLQARGTHVIVYTDESYAHNNHASL